MKHPLLMIAVVFVGCGGGKQKETQGPSQPEPATPPQATEKLKVVPSKLIADSIVEKAVRMRLASLNRGKASGFTDFEPYKGKLTKADLEKVTSLWLDSNQLTEVPKELEKLTKLGTLYLHDNKLTDVKGLKNLTKLDTLYLKNNPALTKAQIAELQKALPNCKIFSSPAKQIFLPVKIL